MADRDRPEPPGTRPRSAASRLVRRGLTPSAAALATASLASGRGGRDRGLGRVHGPGGRADRGRTIDRRERPGGRPAAVADRIEEPH